MKECMYCIIKSTPFSIVLYFALCEGSTSLLNSVDLTIIPSKNEMIRDADYIVYICLNYLKLYEKVMIRNQYDQF